MAFLPLEPRRHLAVDLIGAAEVPAGAYARGDLFDVTISLRNAGNSTASLPALFKIVLTRDRIVGNADDVNPFISTVFLPLAGGASSSRQEQVAISETWLAGDYYTAVVVDEFNTIPETNETNNVVLSDLPHVRIVTEALPEGALAGTDGNDVITIVENWANSIVTVNGVSRFFDWSTRSSLFIDGGPGADRILANSTVNTRLQITGSGGNDLIIGGNGNDELSGANGRDKVFGGSGQDYLLGGASSDYLNGEAGSDTMSGAGGNDRLVDVVGRDYLLGGGGNDVLISLDTLANSQNDPDTLSGGIGDDTAQKDEDDLMAGIETIIA